LRFNYNQFVKLIHKIYSRRKFFKTIKEEEEEVVVVVVVVVAAASKFRRNLGSQKH
jgi:hypothetical protein